MGEDKSYETIKELVFEIIRRTKGVVDYETVTAEVKKHFPKSRWQKAHWTWYRTQIRGKNGRYRNLFSKEVRANLALGKRVQTIKSILRDILENIPRGFMFDSHFVIQRMIKNHSDAYIRFVARYAKGKEPTLNAHQRIGQEIKKFDGRIVEKQKKDSWSENIHGNASSCALWKRI
jgi:hypothetical protein